MISNILSFTEYSVFINNSIQIFLQCIGPGLIEILVINPLSSVERYYDEECLVCNDTNKLSVLQNKSV